MNKICPNCLNNHNSRGIYCNKNCYHDFKRKNKDYLNQGKDSRVVKICNVCKNEFKSYDFRNRKFCSRKCADIFRTGKKASKKHREAISKALKGKEKSIEHRRKIAESWNNRERKLSPELCKKLRLIAIRNIERDRLNGHQLVPKWSIEGCKYFKQFDEEHNTTGQYATNGGEFKIKELGYWVDYINHDLKLIIEWDEYYHKANQEKDIRRQMEIEELYPEYEFRRIKAY